MLHPAIDINNIAIKVIILIFAVILFIYKAEIRLKSPADLFYLLVFVLGWAAALYFFNPKNQKD